VRCRLELLKLLMEQHVAQLKLELAQHNRCARRPPGGGRGALAACVGGGSPGGLAGAGLWLPQGLGPRRIQATPWLAHTRC
jgi:hypothetical protein